jgi:hypothetical protein
MMTRNGPASPPPSASDEPIPHSRIITGDIAMKAFVGVHMAHPEDTRAVAPHFMLVEKD